MAVVAVCGTGLMGSPVALRLAGLGHQVRVWDRSPDRAARLASANAVPVSSPAGAACAADAAIVLVSDFAAVRSVITGPHGVAAGEPGVIVQMSTIAPAEVTALAALLPADAVLLDAPVTGSVPQAGSGRLRVLAGGGEDARDAALPVLAGLGTVAWCGPLGAGSALKCVLNASAAPMIALLAEGLALADSAGLDRRMVLDELELTRLGPLVARKRAMIERRRYPADSRLALFAKDMRLAIGMAAANGTRLRLAGAARLLADEAAAAGLADQDYSVLIEYLTSQVPR
jgi:3-hydroxyisobutyrate dehydrogenase-like beta-hydroxyacid dehydrogenase